MISAEVLRKNKVYKSFNIAFTKTWIILCSSWNQKKKSKEFPSQKNLKSAQTQATLTHFSIDSKCGSRHAAHAAKAMRWRIEQLPKCLFIEKKSRHNVVLYV